MEFKKLLADKKADPAGRQAPAIAFLGDSVTQGCFECFALTPEKMETVFDPASAYPEQLRRMLQTVWPSVPIQLVNAGLSGDCAAGGLARLERDLLRHCPDLCVVCFGLNDSVTGVGEKAYREALEGIFDGLAARGVEAIFMTPNRMADYVSPRLTDPLLRKNAVEIARVQNDGVLAGYLSAGRAAAEKKKVPVCDCYACWQALYDSGADTTDLLSNYLNHPTRQMHLLFAAELFRAIVYSSK